MNEKINISVVIITLNEEHNIRRCLESVKWTDEIVVYDTGSSDKTLDICKEYNCSIYQQSNWEGFGKAKNDAVKLAKYDWIFSIDADEEVSKDLEIAIHQILNATDKKNAYTIKRNSFYMGKMIKYSGWQRDYPLRLFNRKYGNFNMNLVHEAAEIEGEKGKISEVIYHYTYPHIKTHINKMTHYSELGASEAYKKNKKSSICKAVFNGFAKFIKMYLLNLGFLDGKAGLILALNSAFAGYLKYIYLWEKYRD